MELLPKAALYNGRFGIFELMCPIIHIEKIHAKRSSSDDEQGLAKFEGDGPSALV